MAPTQGTGQVPSWMDPSPGFRPGLVSRFFSLEGFLSLTCFGRSPARGAQVLSSCLSAHSGHTHWFRHLPFHGQQLTGGCSPDILGSPTRRTWGQCWSVLIKKGFVTPRTTLGLETEREQEGEAKLGPGSGAEWSGCGNWGSAYGACVRVENSLNSLSWTVK